MSSFIGVLDYNLKMNLKEVESGCFEDCRNPNRPHDWLISKAWSGGLGIESRGHASRAPLFTTNRLVSFSFLQIRWVLFFSSSHEISLLSTCLLYATGCVLLSCLEEKFVWDIIVAARWIFFFNVEEEEQYHLCAFCSDMRCVEASKYWQLWRGLSAAFLGSEIMFQGLNWWPKLASGFIILVTTQKAL